MENQNKKKAELKNNIVGFRLTDSEYSKLHRLAGEAQLSPSDFARLITLNFMETCTGLAVSPTDRLLLQETIALKAIIVNLLVDKNPTPERVKAITAKADELKVMLADQIIENYHFLPGYQRSLQTVPTDENNPATLSLKISEKEN
jgi:hypothetical protein